MVQLFLKYGLCQTRIDSLKQEMQALDARLREVDRVRKPKTITKQA